MTISERFERLCDKLSQLITTTYLGVILLSLWVIGGLLVQNGVDPDLFARVAIGRLISTTDAVPLVDPFSFVDRKPLWIDHEWLSGFIFYHLTQIGGDFALILFKFLAIFLTVSLILQAVGLIHPRTTLVLGWVLFLLIDSSYIWAGTVRAQVFTYLFIPIFLLGFIRLQGDRPIKTVIALPLTMLFWVNAHGGFVVGLGLHGIFLLYTAIFMRKRFIWVAISFALTLLATFLTPYKVIDFWSYIIDATTMQRTLISEWMPASSGEIGTITLYIVTALLIVGMVVNYRRLDIFTVTSLIVSAYFSFRHIRLAAIFLIVAAIFGAPLFVGLISKMKGAIGRYAALFERAFVIVLTAGGVVFASKLSVFLAPGRELQLNYSKYPVAASEWLWNQGSGGRLLVDFNNGSFALWRLYPKYRVSLDGRYEEVYHESTLYDVGRALNPKDPLFFKSLTKLSPDYILLTNDNSQPSLVWKELGWQTVFTDNKFSVLSREILSNKEDLSSKNESLGIWDPRF